MPLASTSPAWRVAFGRSAAAFSLSLLAAAAIVGCQPAMGSGGAAVAVAEAPVPVVSVAAVVQRPVAAQFVQVGRVEAAQRVEIRPRIAGHLEAVLFREGDVVRAGQPLFRIDPRPFQVALDRARAELQLALAREALARSESQRAQRLAAEHAIAMEEVERRLAAHAEANARAAAARAAVEAATLDREFAVVTAPVAGRIGRALVTTGNYVAVGSDQPLATMSATAPLHVHFDVGDAGLITRLAAQRAHGWQARLLDPQTGAVLGEAPIDFVDHEMAGDTGTLRLRARIDQPGGRLLPGQFVRVQLSGAPVDTLLVPERAIASDQGQGFVLVVTPEHQVEQRAVKLGAVHGESRAVTAGLRAGEQVIVSGQMKLRPGMKVQPQPAEPAAASATASPATNS